MDYVILVILLIIVLIGIVIAFKHSSSDYIELEKMITKTQEKSEWPKMWEMREPTLDKYAMQRLDELEKEVKELKKQLEELKGD